MKRLLIITSRDFLRFSNSRIHHLAKFLASKFQETLIIYRPQFFPPQSSLIKRSIDFISIKFNFLEKDGLKLVEVNPLMFRPYGLGTRILNIKNPFEKEQPHIFKTFSHEFLSFIGSVSDFAIIPSLLYVIYKTTKNTSFDLVLTQGPFEAVVGRILKTSGKAKRFVCDDADYEPGFAPTKCRQKLIKLAEKYGMSKAETIVCVGDLLAEKRRIEYKLSNIIVIPNGVDYQHFSKAQNILRKEFCLLYMGFLGGWSGLNLLLDSLIELKKRGNPLPKLLLAGHYDPQFFSFWQQRAKINKIPFDYLGKISYRDLVKVLSKAQIGWALFPPIPLRRYAFSLKVVEYMAGGLAVLSTKDTESGRIVERHRAGLALKYSPSKVAHTINFLRENPDQLNIFRNNAAKAASYYDWKNLLEKYEKFVLK